MASCGTKAMVALTLQGVIIGAVVPFSFGCAVPVIASGFVVGGALGTLVGILIVAIEGIIYESDDNQIGEQILAVGYTPLDEEGPSTAITGDTFGILREVNGDEPCQ